MSRVILPFHLRRLNVLLEGVDYCVFLSSAELELTYAAIRVLTVRSNSKGIKLDGPEPENLPKNPQPELEKVMLLSLKSLIPNKSYLTSYRLLLVPVLHN